MISLFISLTGKGEETLNYDSFVKLVRDKNLDLKIEQTKVNAVDSKSKSIELPAPMLSLIKMKPDRGDDVNGFQVNQTIPFPTKIMGDKSARNNALKSQKQMALVREKEILAFARVLYFNLWAGQERVRLLNEKKNVLSNHLKLARSAVRSDSFARVHVLKAESDLDLLTNDIDVANQFILEAKTNIANFLNEEPGKLDIKANELSLPEIPNLISIEESPFVASKKFQLESLKSRELESKSSWMPDFNIQYKKMNGTAMEIAYSEVMIGVSLPFVFFWEPSSKSGQAKAERLQGEFELQKQKREAESESIKLIARLKSLKKQLELFQVKLIPRAHQRMKIVQNIAPRDMESIQDHRESMEAFPELQLKSLELRSQLEEGIAILSRYSEGTTNE